MTVYKTTDLIENLQQQTESFLQKAIYGWQMTSPAKLLQQPEANKWGAAQCLEHLNSYGRYYLPAIETAKQMAGQRQNSLEQGGWEIILQN